MPANKTPKGRKSAKSKGGQVSFKIEPGRKVQITVEAGEVKASGKVPVTVYVQGVDGEKSQGKNKPAVIAGRPWARLEALKSRLQRYNLATWLFVFAVGIYLITRLIGLTRYPIYFFTDEAIQSQSIVELVANGYRDVEGVLFPTYFRNGEYANLSLSVYLQWLPLILFGKSAVVTRATSVFITLIAAIAVGVILRDVFKIRHWWIGTLFLSITPSWFLHSRTAFETAEFTAFFAGTLCACLLYRYKSPRYLYLTLFLAALAFYTYSPGQLIVPVTAIALLLSDWRYHWENRRMAFKGLLLLAILALPYIRFRIEYPSAAIEHLHRLASYLLEDISLSDKITRYFSEYFIGLSAWYWYTPNDRDLQRHLMNDYGNIMIATLPFAILGLAYILRYMRESANRAILIALLVSPVAAALVQTGITRALIFVIPAAILTTIGFEQVLDWIESPGEQLVEAATASSTTRRILTALFILMLGIAIAYFAKEKVDRIAGLSLATILGLQISGIFGRFAKWLTHTSFAPTLRRWALSQTSLALAVFMMLSGINIYMLEDALKNGPTWFRNYGMGGMQYGAFQIFDIIKQYKQEHPETQIILSPNWANGSDVVARFFLNDPFAIGMGSIEGYVTQKFPLDDDTLFIMVPEEYALATSNSKLTDIHVESIFPYPDATPGFYFVRLRYVDNIDEIFAAEKELRQALRESVVSIDGQAVKVRFSYLETPDQSEAIQLVFDNDPLSLAKTFEANPYVIELTFPSPRVINGFSIVIGAAKAQLTLKCYPTPDAEPIIYTFEGQGTIQQPELSFDLPQPTQVQVLRVEMFDPLSPAPTQIHIWELTLR